MCRLCVKGGLLRGMLLRCHRAIVVSSCTAAIRTFAAQPGSLAWQIEVSSRGGLNAQGIVNKGNPVTCNSCNTSRTNISNCARCQGASGMPYISAEGRSEAASTSDARLFRNSLLGRRFPGLKDLSESTVAQIIMKDPKSDSRQMELRTHPKTDFAPASRPPSQPSRIWSPVNPAEARLTAKRQDSECFIGIGTPYDAHHTDFVQDTTSDQTKRGTAAFRPNSTSQARDAIRIDYYLNSKDEEGKQAELSATRRQAAEQMQQYMTHQTQRRGQMLV